MKPPRANAEIALPPKTYRVQERRSRAHLNYEVALKPGQVVDLREVPAREERYDRLVRKGGGERSVVHGLFVLGAAHGEIVEGEGVMPGVVVGYGLDTRWFSVMVRGRLGLLEVDAGEGRAPRRHEVYGLGLGLYRAIDLEWGTLALGVLGEAAWHRQVFTEGDAAERSTTSGGFGALLSLERALAGGLGLRGPRPGRWRSCCGRRRPSVGPRRRTRSGPRSPGGRREASRGGCETWVDRGGREPGVQ